MMQGWYWDYPKTGDGYCWADTLEAKAKIFSDAGINFVWLPPLARTSSGNHSNGYDPKDLFDYGEYGQGSVSFGTRAQLDTAVARFNHYNIKAVADLVFNHRDGGKMENNPGLENYMAGYTWARAEAGDNPFPSDRFRCVVPLGGASGNMEGDYYIKIRSASQHNKFLGKDYKLYIQTNRLGWQGLPDLTESEPNGGGDCSQVSDNIVLGRNLNATTWDYSGCLTDEFKLTLSATDFFAAGDTLFIYLNNTGSGGYSDHRVYGIWSGPRSMDIVGDLEYQTYTDYSNLPSGRGEMHWNNFKPNSDRATNLGGDWDGMYFFYDYDQFQTSTRDSLIAWTKWNWANVGIRGLRMDAVKHFTPEFVGDMLDAMHDANYDPPLVVGEWYSTNTAELSGWINSVNSAMDADTRAAISPKIFDFTLRESLRKACDDNTFFDTRDIFGGGSLQGYGSSGFNVVTFINNHDFRDASGFASLIHNQSILAYSYILTNNHAGVPCIFYPDYFGYPNDATSYYPDDKDPLKTEIDRLIHIHQEYILNSSGFDALNRSGTPYASNYISGSASKALIYQLSGGIAGKEVIVAINFDSNPLKVDIGVNMTGLLIGDKLTDILGNSDFSFATVSGSNQIYIQLPARSYSVWIEGSPELIVALKPSDLEITSVAVNEVNLSWTDNAINETGFILERKTGFGGSFELLGDTLPANTSSYSDMDVTGGSVYYYRVSAINLGGNSDYSNEVFETIPLDLSGVNIHVAQSQIKATNIFMEYSLNSSDGTDGDWTGCMAGNTTGVDYGAGGMEVWIRQTNLPNHFRHLAGVPARAAAPAVTVSSSGSTNSEVLGANISMEYQYDGSGWMDVTTEIANGTNTFNLAGVHTLLVRVKATATTVASEPTVDLDGTDEPVTTWNGFGWDYGFPNETRDVVLDGNYSEDADLVCKDLTVNPQASLTIPSARQVTVHGNFRIKSDVSGTGSLIDNGTLAITGSKTVELFIAQSDRYYYVSVPSTGITASVFGDIESTELVYLRNTAGSVWERVTSGITALPPGTACAVKLTGAPKTILFTGENIFTGSYVPTVLYEGDFWNLIGNPFPSPVDWGTENDPVGGWTFNNIRNTVYVKHGGNFAIWNAAGNGEALNDGSRYIPAMQSFWIKAVGVSPAAGMSNLVRVHTGNLLLKNTAGDEKKLFVKVFRDVFSDEALLKFSNESESWVDKYDAEKMFATDMNYPQVYMKVENEKLAIASFPEFEGVFQQSLSFKTAIAGQFRYVFSGMESFGDPAHIFLEDKATNTWINLMQNPDYIFESGICDTDTRFVLHFADGSSRFYPWQQPEVSDLQEINTKADVYARESMLYVDAKNTRYTQIKVYNLVGEELFSTGMNGDFLRIPMALKGLVLVQLVGGNGFLVKKVFLE